MFLDSPECQNHDPEIWFHQKTRGLGRHICLQHCRNLEDCKLLAPELQIFDGVVAGKYWRAPSRTKDTAEIAKIQPPEILCQDCLDLRINRYETCNACVICGKQAMSRSIFCQKEKCKKTFKETTEILCIAESSLEEFLG